MKIFGRRYGAETLILSGSSERRAQEGGSGPLGVDQGEGLHIADAEDLRESALRLTGGRGWGVLESLA